MSDNLKEKVSAFGERLKIGGAEMGRKMSAGMTSMSFKMKELFQGQTLAEKVVEEATSPTLAEPDWSTNLEICDMINGEKVNSTELIRAIKKQIMVNNPRVQYLALVLLETCVMNCKKAFSEVASEQVLDEMVKLIDDPQTDVHIRNRALTLIESWGKSANELRYLPIYEETYKSLKSRGIRFPGHSVSRTNVDANPPQQQAHQIAPLRSFSPEQAKKAFDVARNSMELLSTVLSSYTQQDVLKDDLTMTLVQQCRQSQFAVQRIIDTAGDNESLLFEALNVNDEIQEVLSKYEELKKPSSVVPQPEPPMTPNGLEPDESTQVGKVDTLIRKPVITQVQGEEDDLLDDLDEMIFGKKGCPSEVYDPKTRSKDDLMTL